MTPPPQPQGKLIYSSAPWKIYEQDAGMGERDYAVMVDDIFYCRTDDSQTAMKIVEAIRSRPNPSPLPDCKGYALKRIHEPQNNCSGCDSESCADVCMEWLIHHDTHIRNEMLRLVESDEWQREHDEETRTAVLSQIISALGRAIQTDISDNDYVMIEDLESTIQSISTPITPKEHKL